MEDDTRRELGRSELLVLTCTLGGLQVVWSILNGNINIYLLSVGFSASVTPLVWVIVPLCGTFVQPYAGWLSDRCESKFGRRKPFIFWGSIATAVSLVGLSWSQDIAHVVTSSAAASMTGTVVLTVLWTVFLNVSIQPLQMGMRAMIMDVCPKAQQPQANAWASCAISVGNVFGYSISYAAASASFHILGLGHFKYLTMIASMCLTTTVAINLWLCEEPVVEAMDRARNRSSLSSLWAHFRHAGLVSSRTKIINRVQFCAWMGWFPFLFYMTQFVSDLAHHSADYAARQIDSQYGALAGFLYATISCITSFLVPNLLRKASYTSVNGQTTSSRTVATLFSLSLEEVWCMGEIFFSLLMLSTLLANNATAGIILISFAGIPWALANYVPFALLGIEVSDQHALTSDSLVVSAQDEDEDEEDEAGAAQVNFGTGATIGLHNAAISAPQIVAALLSAGILEISTKSGLGDGVGWVMRLSGVAALAAAWNISKLFV